MQYFTLIILSVLLFIQNGTCHNCKPDIAIIGAGIGGASTSHFLTELFNGDLNIDIFEANEIGGRLATVEIDNNYYETGGSIIHARNKYMQDFVKLLGLEHRPTSGGKVGIWNGKEFVFIESDWSVVSIAKLVYKYGVQPFKLTRDIKSILDDFEKMYTLQNDGKYFMNVTSMLLAMNFKFPKLLKISIHDELLNKGYSKEFIDEMVKAAMTVNYGQDTTVQSFVGSVALAGMGSDLWAVRGGNKEVPEHLIYRNKHVNLIPATVQKIKFTENNTQAYTIEYNHKDSTDIMTSMYDIVIIAAPQTHDQKNHIEFENFPEDIEFHGDYHTTIATFVKGDLNARYFGLDENIDAILSCNPINTTISSIGKLTPVEGPVNIKSKVWKIFSNEPLKMETLTNMFSSVVKVKEIPWEAYPEYLTASRNDKFKLHNGIYHVNAIEWAASAMEMSAIGGRNVAILAHSEFMQQCPSMLYDRKDSKVHEKTEL